MTEDLRVNATFDKLGRIDVVDAEYLGGTYTHSIANYDYFGPSRLQKNTLGNTAVLTVGYDGKRRIDSYVWKDATMSANTLVGFEYDYDDVDNPLWQKFLHDNNYYDNYNYDELYRLTDVRYRDSSSIDYTTYVGSWTPAGGAYGNFAYDDVGNRTSSRDGDPFGDTSFSPTSDTYTINDANEYTQVTRNSVNQNPSYDAAGNMTNFPTRPGSGADAGSDVQADAFYDAFNQATRIETTNNQEQHYAYDAFGRRIAAYLITGEEVEYPLAWEEQQPCWIPNYVLGNGRRYIFDGSAVISEQAFDDATRSNATSLLERVHVHGMRLQFTAIDYNNDSTLTNPDSNVPNYDTSAGGYDGDSLKSPASDRAFYYLCNAGGKVMGLSAGSDDEQMLEYRRYRAFGEAIHLDVVDDGSGSGTPDDLIEDTNSDLGDNNTAMVSARTTYGSHVRATSGFGASKQSSSCDLNTAVGIAQTSGDSFYIVSSRDHSEWEKNRNAKARNPKKHRDCVDQCRSKIDWWSCTFDCDRAIGIEKLPYEVILQSREASGDATYTGVQDYIAGRSERPRIVTNRAINVNCGMIPCLIAHEEQHHEDLIDCMKYARKAYDKAKRSGASDKTLGAIMTSVQGPAVYTGKNKDGKHTWDSSWYTANEGWYECRAYCRTLKCIEEKLMFLGIIDARGKIIDNCNGTINDDCCKDLVTYMTKEINTHIGNYCPKHGRDQCDDVLAEDSSSMTAACKKHVDKRAEMK